MNINDRIMVLEDGRRILLPMVCQSPSGNLDVEQVRLVLGSDRYSVLVTGETGCGKEMLADCAFDLTRLAKGKCQKINCAGLDRNLIGSELFGHKQGAFTGAHSSRPGLLKECDGGILFLDEIGWLPPDLQARLLRFMETGEIRPLGADKLAGHAQVRIIAATNKDVSDRSTMLPDLRNRFDFEFCLPPLRERGADVLWFLCEPGFLGTQNVFTGVTLRTLLGMMCHPWLGNVRELKKYCQRKVLLRTAREPNGEVRHILEDWALGDITRVDGCVAFAGFALAAAELRSKKFAGFMNDADIRRVLAFLVGVHVGSALPMGFCTDKNLAIVPIRYLRAAIANELPGLGRFALKMICKWVEMEFRGLDLSANSYAYSGPDGNVLDFGGAMEVLGRLREAFEKVSPSYKESVHKENGQLRNALAEPSAAFVKQIGYAGPDGLLFNMPEPPDEVAGLDVVLDQLGITGQDREMCVRYHNGNQSCDDIATAMKIGLSTVKDHLAELRRKYAELAQFLKTKPAGRKARK